MTLANKDWINPLERRLMIYVAICEREHVTMEQLANEFGVSIRTIRYDINELSLFYPIETIRGRNVGGVRLIENMKRREKYLNTVERDFLEKLKDDVDSSEVKVIDNILNKFDLCR